ncbi:HAD-IIIA family hydrolase [Streptomyces sp. SID625]|nr:HAD-IIIA family hydrolase [Streptomyces sp. SID625]
MLRTREGKSQATFFLDRDGTVNAAPPPGLYLTRPEELRLLPGAAEAVRTLNRRGHRVVVVTNQRGVARGLVTSVELAAVERRLAELLGAEGAHWDGYYVCPHAADSCRCRKPRPGLLEAAARDIPRLSLPDAVMIGDSETDVGAGRAAGCRTVRLAPPGTPSAADLVVADLGSAVRILTEGE